MARITGVGIVCFTFCCTVEAQMPVIETLQVQSAGTTVLDHPNWVPLVGSVKTVDLPAGQVFITWSAGARVDGGRIAVIRPFIGDYRMADWEAPTINVDSPDVSRTHSHSWATTIEAGTYEVGLEARGGGGAPPTVNGGNLSMSWTLIAFPDTTGNVPAVSVWGLLFLGLCVLIVGSVLVSRRRAVAPSRLV
jgi:hypothetical protein